MDIILQDLKVQAELKEKIKNKTDIIDDILKEAETQIEKIHLYKSEENCKKVFK